MRLHQLARRLTQHPNLFEATQPGGGSATWSHLSAGARPCLAAGLYASNPRQTLLVVRNYEAALSWQAKLILFGVPQDRIRLLPSGLSALFEDAAPETVALSDRLGSLRFLASQEPGFVIATPQAALERTLHTLDILENTLEFAPGLEIESKEAASRLLGLGYEASDPVRVPGQYCRRGGILDIFPVGHDLPVRVEFFGDTIESIRRFDPMTQRSSDPAPAFSIGISRETVLPSPELGLDDMLQRAVEVESANLGEDAAKRLEELVNEDRLALENQTYFDRLDLYRPLIQPDGPCAIDYLGEEGLLILDEPLDLESTAVRLAEELGEALSHRHQRGEILESHANDFVHSAEHFADAPNLISLTAMNAVPDWIGQSEEFEIGAAPVDNYRGQPAALTRSIQNWVNQGLCVVFATDQPSRTRSVLAQVEIFPTALDNGHPWDQSDGLPPGLYIIDGNPAAGFAIPKANLAVMTDHELYGVARLKLPQRKFSEGMPITTVLDLKPGDFVVHINFGIGVFQGLVQRTQDGIQKEYLHIKYKAPDQLFVPADQLDRIQKYVSPSDAEPKINRLTGGEWKKAVAKAREEAREFARDLIKLYAERKKVTRDAYRSDAETLHEMENTFPYVETPSQLQAINDVKQDLKSGYPMDRLVCGDVGFGKTEVAVRAAFLVAQSGKQVAILCPTTILSEQHYRSFSERLAGFDIEIALLNRFVTAGERRQALEKLESGELDIVIGTHALLSSELKFKDLGLLVIDEEQKFGVKHKESLKKLRVNVDVLSMSATPIPRTLSMALMNIREMSLINDPPPGRLPVRTFVRPTSNEVVREAVLRELARGGQVFYVYNRVSGIYHVADRLKKLVPHARVAVGHGQMTEKELEPVMVGFVQGEIDVLVSTTIVEAGLDIPNANTLIVENADYFGLSQLYQLRGRVGRSDRQAYAYLLYAPDKSLTETGTERLTALAEFNQLGSGYSLAFRDLQIRGAGDILGAKQSGQMMAIGYDLYTQLIESEVQFLKTYADGDRPSGYEDPLAGLEPLPAIDLPVQALIPEHFVEDPAQRLYFYKQLMTARNPLALAEVAADLEDRYGRLPKEVKTAVDIMAARITARELHIQQIDGNQGRLKVTFSENHPPHPRIPGIIARHKGDAYMSQDDLIWPFAGSPLEAVHSFLKALDNAQTELAESRIYSAN
ncbi:MAG: transcription-repair coupling factor [Armatimonadetes bacterium]|nr:transcription-repair coupling factor [Armatimonadota bacterium]